VGYDFYSVRRKEHFQLGAYDWRLILNRGMAFGWKPKGTRKRSANWKGYYSTNDNQLVLKTDALNLAKALKDWLEVDGHTLSDEIKEFIKYLKRSDGFRIR